MLTKEEIQAYLDRIGIPDIQAPTKAYLFELHKAHVSALSWQTIDIYAGRPAPIGFRESVRLLSEGRSGYCFHLNGAFSLLLRSLGYNVSLHRAGVQPLGEEPRINSFHLGLTVDLAEGPGAPEDRWIADVGLGDLPFEPLPLRFGAYEQGALAYQLVPSGVAAGGWRLEHDPRASFAGVDFDPEVLPDLEEFRSKHAFYSQSPESPWVDLFLVRNRQADESNEIRGCVWSKLDRRGKTKTELTTKSRWLEALGDLFGERLVRYDAMEREELWKRISRAHEVWKRSKTEGALP
ncbi:arylamine N-acetyltransferase family protein [Paenibacillus arenilitoris]|uniref:Arylamine N-acetyltransferase n=1 Tax=Paenibacillus arenilitoris TaxID=2772299 RepID=A0A927CHJ4_9BACL|nr:arylamine N-acetyltransferase [Paenibacillus arenilitoris]MBD2868214.1 arylamine N-acetyltransferase [Paenibacillus arenilitoris]